MTVNWYASMVVVAILALVIAAGVVCGPVAILFVGAAALLGALYAMA